MHRGFTLIEIVVVISLFIILSTGLFISFNTYRFYFVQNEEEIFVSTLHKARNRALNNIYQSAHGVCYDSANSAYIIFSGRFFDRTVLTNDILIGAPGVEIISTPTIICQEGESNGVIFTPLTSTTSQTTVQIFHNFSTTTININPEGGMEW